MWVAEMEHKSDAGPIIIDWIRQIETHTVNRVKTILSDKAGEFTAGTLGNFMRVHGIRSQTTEGYNSAQYGNVERFQWTIRNKGMSSRFPTRPAPTEHDSDYEEPSDDDFKDTPNDDDTDDDELQY